ncbi:MAG: PAS domain-containing sensor histidine kinase [Endomicrobiales bacterium]
MPVETTDTYHLSSAQRLSSVLSYIVFGFGLWGLIGWNFVARYLDSRTVKLVVMAPVAAVLYMLTGMALWAFQENRVRRFGPFGILCVVPALILSGISLADYLPGLNIQLEPAVLYLLGAQKAAPVLFGTVITANVGLFIISIALLLLQKPGTARDHAAQVGVTITGMAGLASLIGYLYSFSPLYFAIESRWVVALPSAIALACASLSALLLRPGRGFVALFVGGDFSGISARRYLLYSIAVPFAVGAVLAYARRITRIPAEESILLFALIVILLSLIIVYLNSRALKKVAEELRASEERLKTIFENLAEGLIVVDPQGNTLQWNRRALELHGYAGREDAQRFFTEELARVYALFDMGGKEVPFAEWPVSRILREGSLRDYVLRIRNLKKDDWERVFSYGGALVRDPDGRPSMALLTIRDVTAQKKAEEARDKSEREVRAITDNSPDVIARFDRQLRHTFINPCGEKVYGRRREEIIGKTNAELGMPPDKVDLWKRHFEQVFATGRQQSMEFDFDSPTFGRQHFLSVFVPEFNAQGEVQSILDITRDITQLKEVQKHLFESVHEAKRRADEAEEGRRILDALMDNIPEGIIVTDAQGRIRSISSYLSRISGHDRKQVVGKKYRFIDELLDEPAALLERRKAERGEARKAGMAAVAESPLAVKYPLTRALEKGDVTLNEERRVYLRGGAVHTAVLNAAPVRDAGGRVIGAVSAWRDITDRKKAEEAVKASNRELEQFAYVASHDLQEPLRMVASFTELLERRYRDKFDQKGKEYLGFIVDGATRMQRLIQDLLAYSRIGRLDTGRSRVDCNEVVDGVIRNLTETIRETGARVTRDPLPSLIANETSFARLFQNLISNAIKFRKKDVPPRAHVGARKKGGEWLFSVSDNGIGIEPTYFSKLFVIFQRLHSRQEYPGTGMGLAISKKIVETYGGRIWVESETGKGSTFYFTIPER